jgi:hypothetical protein
MNDGQAQEPGQRKRPLLRNEVISEALLDPNELAGMGLPTGDNDQLPIVIELNLLALRIRTTPAAGPRTVRSPERHDGTGQRAAARLLLSS